MYLEQISLTNTGPIEALKFELPFSNTGNPIPVFLVGKNGSGKSTALSYIVNAIVAAKAEVFDDTEVEPGKVFRLRSPQFIRHGSVYSHASLKFSDDVSLEEWQLTKPRKVLETQLTASAPSDSWKQIPEGDTDSFEFKPIVRQPFGGSPGAAEKLRTAYNEGCVLYFPPNRFEEPSWLNELNLRSESVFGKRKNIQGLTQRRIFSDVQIGVTTNWLLNVVLDQLVYEKKTIPVATMADGASQPIFQTAEVFDGPNSNILNALTQILVAVFSDRGCDDVKITLGNKRNRTLRVSLLKEGTTFSVIPDLFSLSSGESAIFALFSTILRDFDFGTTQFSNLSDVRGIVVIDEVDLHLHLNLQRRVLPKLFAMFPSVQFIITTHSPLLLLGMQEEFGSEGFLVASLPDGQPVAPEMFGEFDAAYSALQATERFEDELQARVKESARPLLLTEGRSDVIIVNEAWARLRPGLESPFDVIPAGIDPNESTRNGGAESLRRQLEFLPATTNRPIAGVFDNDRAGNEKFKGLNKTAFEPWSDQSLTRKHHTANVWGMLLPVPPERKKWVTANDLTQRYLSIEHFFSDDVLREHSLIGPSILGTEVFEVNDKKMKFAELVSQLDDFEFSNFELLFELLAKAPPFESCQRETQ